LSEGSTQAEADWVSKPPRAFFNEWGDDRDGVHPFSPLFIVIFKNTLRANPPLFEKWNMKTDNEG